MADIAEFVGLVGDGVWGAGLVAGLGGVVVIGLRCGAGAYSEIEIV